MGNQVATESSIEPKSNATVLTFYEFDFSLPVKQQRLNDV